MASKATVRPQTSEERCRAAFEEHWSQIRRAVGYDISPAYRESFELGWDACWRFLQENAYKEFIER